MSKAEIIAEIKRIAKINNNNPPGIQLFERHTGIKVSMWYGKYWTRWADALIEAGYQPNKMQKSYDEKFIIEKFISLMRELNKFPTSGELRIKSTNDCSFPSHTTFERLGNKKEKAQKIIDYCGETDSNQNIIELCRSVVGKAKEELSENEMADIDDNISGFVYLIKSGKYYKIGKTNSPGRRCYELNLQLPEKIKVIHKISTDDPSGIEEYWHKRFKDKRKNGEWFELNSSDINAFRRRKFM